MKKCCLLVVMLSLVSLPAVSQAPVKGVAKAGRRAPVSIKQTVERLFTKNKLMVTTPVLKIEPVPIVKHIPTGIMALRGGGLGAGTDFNRVMPPRETMIGFVQTKELTNLSSEQLDLWAAALEEKYGTNKFDGYLVHGISAVNGLTGNIIAKPLSAKQALEKAIAQAARDVRYYQNGFLAIVVQGNQYRAKDVVLMDLANKRWITINGSKGKAMRIHQEYFKTIADENNQDKILSFGASTVLESRHGLKRIGYSIFDDVPSATSFSDDLLTWHVVDNSSPYGQYLDEAMEKAYELNYFAKFFPHEHKLRFSATQDGELLETPEEVTQMLEAQQAGLDVEVKDYHPIIKFKPGTVANVGFQEGFEVFFAEGRAVTENALPHEDAVCFAKDVLELSQKHPQEVLVLYPLGAKPYTGNITDYIVKE